MKLTLKSKDGAHTLSTTAIVNADLDIYDEPMVHSRAAKLVKVTIFLNAPWLVYYTHHPELEPAVWTWSRVQDAINTTELPCSLYDQKGLVLVSGNNIEYKINNEQGTVEIAIKSKMGDILQLPLKNQTAENEAYYQFNTGGEAENDEKAREIVNFWIGQRWATAFKDTGVRYIFSDWDYAWGHLRWFIAARGGNPHQYINGARYFIVWEQNTFSNSGDIVKAMACNTACKATFDIHQNAFLFEPYDHWETPINIIGHVVSMAYATREEQDLTIIFKSIRIRCVDKTSQGDNKMGSSFFENRLKRYLKHYSYEIWGYAPDYNDIITSGQSVLLNGETYCIQDINYEPETLDTIKTFKANVVRWADINYEL